MTDILVISGPAFSESIAVLCESRTAMLVLSSMDFSSAQSADECQAEIDKALDEIKTLSLDIRLTDLEPTDFRGLDGWHREAAEEMRAVVYRAERERFLAPPLPFFDRNPSNGQPRSYRETRRQSKRK